MKQIFAKLFDDPDKQILVRKTFDSSSPDEPFGVEISSMKNDIIIQGTFSFESINDRDDFYDTINENVVVSFIRDLCF